MISYKRQGHILNYETAQIYWPMLQGCQLLSYVWVDLHVLSGLFFHRASEEISSLKLNLSSESKSLFGSKHDNLTLAQTTLKTSTKEELDKQRNYLQHQKELVTLFDPKQLLERGYAWARKAGKLMNSVEQLKPEDELVVSLSDGDIKTKIIEIYGKKEA